MQIDHDPNEPQRPMKGETLVVTIGTTVCLVGLGLLLKWIDRTYGEPALWLAVGVLAVTCFGLAFAGERKKGQRRG